MDELNPNAFSKVGIHTIDVVVLVAYLAGITFVGIRLATWVRSSSDYFMPRRFGKGMMIANAFGTGTASDQAVTVAAATFSQGLSGIWWQWLWLPATPFYWLLAPIMRRFRAVTTADVYELRFDRSVATLFAIVGVLGLSAKIGLMLKGAGALFEACTGGAVPAHVSMPLITVLFVVYGTAGGLSAAIVTDFFQGVMTLLFSFMLLPFVLSAVNGLPGIRASIQDPSMLQLLVPGEIGVFFVIMFSMQSLLGIVAQPFIMGVCAAGRTELDGRVGFMVGNIVKRVCTMAWSVTALAALAWYLNRGIPLSEVNPDHVYGDVARAFLPSVMPGLLGLFLASLLASVMSSCDAFMISSAALITENIYRRAMPNHSEAHYIRVGRFAGLFVVLGGVWFAYNVPDVISALSTWLKIAPMMGIAFWLGLLWRRMTPAGAWATTIAGFASWWLVTREWLVQWCHGHFGVAIPGMFTNATQMGQPWVILIYTASAAFAGIFVSLLTRPVAKERLDLFYALTRTPIAEDEVVSGSCQLPVGVDPPNRRMLCSFGGLEIPTPSPMSIGGFIVGWLAIAMLVGGFVVLVGT